MGSAAADTRDPRRVEWMDFDPSFSDLDGFIYCRFMVIIVSSLDFVDSEFTDTLCDGNWPVSG